MFSSAKPINSSSSKKQDRKRKSPGSTQEKKEHTDIKHSRVEHQLTPTQKTDLTTLQNHIVYVQEKLAGCEKIEIEAKNFTFSPEALGIRTSTLTGSSEDSIDASVGSSGFFAPKKMFNNINTYQRESVVEYGFNIQEIKIEDNLAEFLQRQNIIGAGTKVELTEDNQIQKPYTIYSVLGCGSQHLMTEFFRALTKRYDVVDDDFKDIFVVPTPTYGLFFESILEAGAKYVLMPMQAVNDYETDPQMTADFIINLNNDNRRRHVDLLKLKFEKIQKYIQKNKFSRDLYDTLNNIETKLRQGSACSKLIRKANGQIKLCIQNNTDIKNKSYFIEKLRIPFRNCVRGLVWINPHNPTGRVITQAKINAHAAAFNPIKKLTIMEDAAHLGISLQDVKPGTFQQTVMSNRTVSFFSCSKNVALASMRAGFAIGPYKHINKIADFIYKAQVGVPFSVTDTVNKFTAYPQEKLEKYYKNCNSEYNLRLQIVKENLELNNLSLLTDPQGCFFTLIDFSNYKGYYLGNTQLNTGNDFAMLLFYLADVKTIPNEWNGAFDVPAVRFSLSISEEQIQLAMNQIKSALTYLTRGPNPRFEYDNRSFRFNK